MLHEALAAYLEIAIARNTVHQMLGFLDDCFLVRFPDAGKRLLTLDRDNLPGTLPDGVVAETAYEWMLNEGAPS